MLFDSCILVIAFLLVGLPGWIAGFAAMWQFPLSVVLVNLRQNIAALPIMIKDVTV
jgi:hypothetical protein